MTSTINPTDIPENYPTLLERYYTRRYRSDGVYCFQHLNDLLIIGISKEHPALQENIIGIEFTDVVRKSVTEGKRKVGALYVKVDTKICDIIIESGERHPVTAGINAQLVDWNPDVEQDPTILIKEPEGKGYLAIFQMTNKKHHTVTGQALANLKMITRIESKGKVEEE